MACSSADLTGHLPSAFLSFSSAPWRRRRIEALADSAIFETSLTFASRVSFDGLGSGILIMLPSTAGLRLRPTSRIAVAIAADSCARERQSTGMIRDEPCVPHSGFPSFKTQIAS